MTEVPFGYIEIRNDIEVWCLEWEERLELLELYVCASGWNDPEDAHQEFWDYVTYSAGRYLIKDFEPIPDDKLAEFEKWVLEGENED